MIWPTWKQSTQEELDRDFSWGSTAPEQSAPVTPAPVRVTYEVSGDEPLHPDPQVAARMYEIGMSNCGFGCKVYADPNSRVRVLAHNSSYGCPK